VPTLETLAAVDLLRREFVDLAIRVVNVVDLLCLEPPGEHPHGLSDADFDALFTRGSPVVFAFHGYPWLVHRLTYRRNNHDGIHVRGYKEEGTTTTPFDMCVRNEISRWHLAMMVLERVERLADRGAHLRQRLRDRLIEHAAYITEHGEDLPDIRDWRWPTA
jgi:xylulose-5-phosphate/fructose-6-phosphate phosphoketolase